MRLRPCRGAGAHSRIVSARRQCILQERPGISPLASKPKPAACAMSLRAYQWRGSITRIIRSCLRVPIGRGPGRRRADDFEFEGTPINETLVNDLAGGGFMAQQRNVVLVGGDRDRQTILPSPLPEIGHVVGLNDTGAKSYGSPANRRSGMRSACSNGLSRFGFVVAKSAPSGVRRCSTSAHAPALPDSPRGTERPIVVFSQNPACSWIHKVDLLTRKTRDRFIRR